MKDQLLEIEAKYHVKVLFACEAGSRAWGLASENSDHDVRFIYVHPLEWYLDIDQKRDVIENPITKSLDLSGWDLRKALFLLKKSNPPLLEWLHSDIIYMKESPFYDEMKNLANRAFSAKACLFHYLNMAKRNAKNIFQKDRIKVKQYLNVLRPLLSCKAMEAEGSFPTVHFPNLAAKLITDDKLKKEINQLIHLKRAEKEYISRAELFYTNEYIKSELLYLEEYVNTITVKKGDITEELNQFFRKTLKEGTS
ncbi:nucleotidyltransferase domain-containing protein [Margalitia sp. FSL K6-0131]|uniref:nucleotidyltransferase domain-containing protein n=1 Tax=Margalitia sp. FSL K6-0131 TaxID=2954604 RepID=UPI0030FA5E71